ncbi:MAG TPA: carboxymuconolactone decarboxylase family protein, partial [Burkholderiales bacterium]
MARIKPLPQDHSPELKEAFAAYDKSLGFVPNSMLILQRKPKIVKAMAQLTASIWDPEGEVDRAFKRLVAHVASGAAGCQYCMAHTAG